MSLIDNRWNHSKCTIWCLIYKSVKTSIKITSILLSQSHQFSMPLCDPPSHASLPSNAPATIGCMLLNFIQRKSYTCNFCLNLFNNYALSLDRTSDFMAVLMWWTRTELYTWLVHFLYRYYILIKAYIY